MWQRLIAALLGIAMGLVGPGLYALIVNGEPARLWGRLRMLLLYSATGLSLLALGIGWLDAETLASAIVVLVAVFVVIHFVLEKRSSPLIVGLGDEVVEARLLKSSGPAAFSFTGTSKIYVSEALAYMLSPEELLAIVAHEKGHAVSLKPLSPSIANSVLAIISVAVAMGVVNQVLSGSIANLVLGALSALAAWGLWVTYNWAWESLADLYSVEKTGPAAYTALQKITGAVPRPLTLREAYLSFIRSMKPRRVRGGIFLANPHPCPSTRLYVIQRALILQSLEQSLLP